MAVLELSAPWEILYKEITALFGEDEDIRIVYDRVKDTIKLYVSNAAKADALATILPGAIDSGGKEISLVIIPANKGVEGTTYATVYETAFKGNPAFSKVISFDDFNIKFTYVVFTNKVVQFYTDNLADYHGFKSTLYEDIAREIFVNTDKRGAVFFCTDVPDEIAVTWL